MTIPTISRQGAISAAIIVVVLLALVWGGYWLLNKPLPPPPLSPAAEAAVRDGIRHSQATVADNTKKAQAAASSASTSYETGKAYSTVAATIHQQGKSHAKPTPISDSAAARLERELSNY